jgi:phosphate transport system substrate-binding protein
VISKKWLSIAGAGVLALGLVACGDDEGDGGTDGGTEEQLSGTIVVDGSSTVQPLTSAASELFAEDVSSDVQVTVGTAGTGGGFERFCRGETDISDASRPIDTEDEAEGPACEAAGIEYVELQVANDALSVMVHPDNPVECLTVEQLNQIWGAESTITSWGEVDGVEGFDEPLDLYAPGTTSGTYDYFNEAITDDAGLRTEGYTDIGENDNAGITGIEGSTGGMFFAGFSFFLENEGRVKALQVDSGAGCVAPSLETVLDGSYAPLSRPLFIYPKLESLQRPEVEAFVQYFIENAAEIAEARGFVGLTPEQQSASQSALDGALGG